MARIAHPRFQPGRTKALGIEFIDGFAEVDLTDRPILRQALEQHGYGIEEFAIVELPDGTVIGDGTSIITLSADLDGTGGDLPEYVEGDGEKIAPARRSRKK